jgi:hypothetical protein
MAKKLIFGFEKLSSSEAKDYLEDAVKKDPQSNLLRQALADLRAEQSTPQRPQSGAH